MLLLGLLLLLPIILLLLWRARRRECILVVHLGRWRTSPTEKVLLRWITLLLVVMLLVLLLPWVTMRGTAVAGLHAMHHGP